jgi:SPP1 gp7 family putative phage head morphogenesis protein
MSVGHSRRVQEFHRRIHIAAEQLLREAPSLQPVPGRRFVLTPKLARLERKRLRDKIKPTRNLRAALLNVLDGMEKRFFALSGLAGFLREADGDVDAGRLHSDAQIRAAIEAAMVPEPIADALFTAMRDMYAAGITSAADELGQIIESPDWDVAQTRAIKAIDAYALKFSKNVVGREKDALKELVRDSIEQGTSTVDLAAMISEHFADGLHFLNDAGKIERSFPSDAWAEMVARTETTRAYTAGVTDLYRQADVDKVMFLSSQDERVCDECDDLDGQTYAIDDAPDIPIHPSCRCVYVIAPDDPLQQADEVEVEGEGE